MKYDEKTGDKKPESRSDEIELLIEQLKDANKKCNGQFDKMTEFGVILQSVNVSLGLIVDICGMILNKLNTSQVADDAEQ